MTDTTQPAPYANVAKENWQAYFDALTKILDDRRVEIEVIGLDLGDQIEAEWLPLNGMTYDPKADAFYVYVEGADRDLGHAIPRPREILVHTGEGGVDQVVVMDHDGHEHIVRLQEPLEAPRL